MIDFILVLPSLAVAFVLLVDWFCAAYTVAPEKKLEKPMKKFCESLENAYLIFSVLKTHLKFDCIFEFLPRDPIFCCYNL